MFTIPSIPSSVLVKSTFKPIVFIPNALLSVNSKLLSVSIHHNLSGDWTTTELKQTQMFIVGMTESLVFTGDIYAKKSGEWTVKAEFQGFGGSANRIIWASEFGVNGNVFISETTNSTLLLINNNAIAKSGVYKVNYVDCIHNSVVIPNVHRINVQRRFKVWWSEGISRIVAGNFNPNDVGGGGFMCWERMDGGYGCIIVVDGQDRKVKQVDGIARVGNLIVHSANDLHACIHETMELVRKYFGGHSYPRPLSTDFPLLSNFDSYYDYVGFCTWNTFYKDPTHKSVIDTIDYYKHSGINFGFLILDDGYLQTTDPQGKLISFKEDTKKFPFGLIGFINACKELFPDITVGVWHTLYGYWRGIDGELAKRFKTFHADFAGGDSATLVDTSCLREFFTDWFTYLKSQGVEFVKVDSQASIDDLVGESHKEAWRAYQSIAHSPPIFNPTDILHCMSHSPRMLLSHLTKPCTIPRPLVRTSDDFFPLRTDTLAAHFRSNLTNALYFSECGLQCDFDMFQTRHPLGNIHAALRSISGGPVYVTDEPGYMDPTILIKLVEMYPNNKEKQRILRCENVCTADTETVLDGSEAFVAYNTWGEYKCIGAFNCGNKPSLVKVKGIQPGYIGITTSTRRIITSDKMLVFLLPFQYEIINYARIYDVGCKVAIFGLIDKFNPAVSVSNIHPTHNGIECFVRGFGQFCIWSENTPSIKVEGISVKVSSVTKGLSIVDMMQVAAELNEKKWNRNVGIHIHIHSFTLQN